jgi:hypothetical protein
MPARRAALILATLALGLGACSGDGGVKDEELEGLVVSPPSERPPVDLDKATADGVELGRALTTPHHEVAAKLGAHQLKVTSRIEVKEGDTVVETLSDETVLEYAADGQYHAKYDNSADYGREVLWQAGALYLRPRYARWHRRPPTNDSEPQTIRDQMYAVAGEYFDLVAHAAEVTDKGAATVAGRGGRRVEIKLAPSPRKPAAQVLTQRKWRETVTVQALTGEAVLDAEAALPLSARFAATLAFSRDGRSFTMTLEVGHEVTSVGQAVALVTPPPEEVVDTPQRSREVDERDQLLDGFAPSSKKAGPQPAAPGGP